MPTYERCVEAVDSSDLPTEVAERIIDSLGFTQSFHELMADLQMLRGEVKVDDIDVNDLENAFNALIGEFQAACIFLASFSNSEKGILETYNSLVKEDNAAVPSLVLNGYKKLAERVVRTRNSLKE